MTGEELEKVGEVGEAKIGDLKLFPGNVIAKLVAVAVQSSPEIYEIVEGNFRTREVYQLGIKGEVKELAAMGYIYREYKTKGWQEGSSEICSKFEIWEIKKKLIFAVYRAFINREGNVLLEPVFKTVKSDKVKEIYAGVFYKLPNVRINAEFKNLDEILTPECLVDSTVEGTTSRLGIKAYTPLDFGFYLVRNYYPDKITERWSLVIPIPPDFWVRSEGNAIEAKYFSPERLVMFRNMGLIDDLTYEFAMAALFAGSTNEKIRETAKICMLELNKGFEEKYHIIGEDDILQLRENILIE